ncbi:MAG: EFR1 family ferrodoxin [Candidatus Omnitrophota bacterium]
MAAITTIFYFTGTGNCLKVAEDLAEELGGAHTVNMAAVVDKEIDLSSDCIGLVYPVYMFGMPLLVKRFIKQLKSDKNKYIFSISTYGGESAGTLSQNAALLKAQGLKLSAGFIVKMPGNYTPLYEAIPIEKQNEMFKNEEQKIKDIARIVKEKKENRIERGAFLAGLFLSGIIYNFMSLKIPALDKNFWADDKCISCGSCVKVCPVNNIRLSDKKPLWLHKCEQCFACLHWCPREAIQYGKNTAGRKRYRNPAVKLESLLLNK